MKNPIVFIIVLLVLVLPSAAADYAVKRGDTLYSLARDFDLTVDELMDFNGIDDPTTLRVGQVLRIPGDGEGTGGRHTVVSGETLYGLAREYGISVVELRRINSMDANEVLAVGRVLVVPGGQSAETVPVPGSGTTDDPDIPDPPAVPDGDLLWPHGGRRIQLTGSLKGIEIVGVYGDPIVSVSAGQVVLVQPFRTYGKLVIVESDDHYIYIYGGSEQTLVAAGDRVEAGTRIGTLGMSPGGGSKVYFAVHKDSKYVDPAKAPRM